MVRPVFMVLEAAGTGGTEVYVEGLARHLAAYGKVTVLALHGDVAALQNRFHGLRVAVTGGVNGLGALAREHPDALFNLHVYTSLLPAAQALRRAKAQVVTTLHLPLGNWNILHRMRWRLAVARSTAVIGVSAACLTGFGPLLRGKPVAKVGGPMPLDMLPVPQRVLPLDAGGLFEVFFVGRLEREKDLSVLVRAMDRLQGARLTIIGDGSERARLVQEAEALGVNIRFTGALVREQVFDRLAGAHAFVLPSRFEGLGLAALEAMALGVPTITADFQAAEEYIRPEETGLIFRRGDSMALADCLKRLRGDGALRQRLSECGASFVRQHFAPDRQYGLYRDFLSRLERP